LISFLVFLVPFKPVFALTPLSDTCFLPLAFFSPEATPDELAVLAYRRLVEKLGVGLLTESDFKRWSEAENPFDVDGPVGHDVSALKKYLRELESMLSKKGWRTFEMEQRIRQELLVLSKSVAGASRRVDDAMGKNLAQTNEFPFPSGGMAVSPDGRWFVGEDRIPGASATSRWTVYVFDGKEKSLKKVSGPKRSINQPFFSRDGSHLVFHSEAGQLHAFPFRDGEPAWAEEKVVGSKQEGEFGPTHMNVLSHSTKSNLFLVGESFGHPFLYDAANGTRNNLWYAKALRPKEHVVEIGFVPGTDEVYVVAEHAGDSVRHLRKFDLNSAGQLGTETEMGKWMAPKRRGEMERPPVFWLADGRPILIDGEKNEAKLRLRMGSDQKLVEVDLRGIPASAPLDSDNLISFLRHPSRAKGAFVFITKMGRDVVWYDFAANKITGRLHVPDAIDLELSEQADRLYGAKSDGHRMIIDVEHEWE